MSVRKARAIVWAYNAILFLLFVVLMTVFRPKYPIVAGIIFVLVYWFGPDYGQRTANKLLDNMWLQADKLGLSAADLGKVTKYQGSIDLELTRPEHRTHYLPLREIKRINKLLNQIAEHSA